MPRYIWQLPQRPIPEWNARQLLRPLADCRRRQGTLLAKLAGIGLEDSLRAQAQSLEEDVVQTAAIEGERLDREQVRLSVAVHLGLNQGGLRPADRATDGLVMVLLDATQNHVQPLTAERLCGWQAALFLSGYSGLSRIVTGAWREKPMQVVSGPLERRRVHFDAPPPERIDAEMESFLSWWKESRPPWTTSCAPGWRICALLPSTPSMMATAAWPAP